MLVLTRSVGESVVIGDEIIVKVVEVRGDVVRLGVEAPTAVRIYREELYRALVESNQAAAAAGPPEALAALLSQAARRGGAGQSDAVPVPAPTGSPASTAQPGPQAP